MRSSSAAEAKNDVAGSKDSRASAKEATVTGPGSVVAGDTKESKAEQKQPQETGHQVDGTAGVSASSAAEAKAADAVVAVAGLKEGSGEADNDVAVVVVAAGAGEGDGGGQVGELNIREDKPWDTDTYKSLPKASDGRQLRDTYLPLPTPRPEDTVMWDPAMKDNFLPMVAKTRRDLLKYDENTANLAAAVVRACMIAFS